MIRKIGLTIFILTVAFSLGNCADDFDQRFSKIGSYERINSNKQKVVRTWYMHESGLNWLEASGTCCSYNMEFGYFKSIEERNAFISLFHKFSPQPGVWFGYTDQGHEGTWTSVSGEVNKVPLDFQVNEPSNSGGDENCLHLEKKGEFLFNDVNCAIGRPFICQKTEIINPPTTTTVAPTTTTVAPTLVKFNEIGQYEHSHRKGITKVTWYVSETKETWSDSADICEKNGKHLVTFDKLAEANALLAAYEKYEPHPDAWIGYTDQDHEGRWTDNDDKDLMFPIEFHDSEPNNKSGKENCLQMWSKTNQLKYNDTKCDRKMNFICVTYSFRPKTYTVTEAPADGIIDL